jgi:serine/threonine-protein kinase
VLPALGIAEWVFSLLVVLCLSGFPVAMALAWVFDITPEGVKRTRALEEMEEGEALDRPGEARAPRRSLLWSAVRTASVIGAMAILGIIGWRFSATHTSPPSTDLAGPPTALASIAVLPFVDMSATGDQAYLGDGMAEEILNLLAQIKGIRVAARTSAFAFRDQDIDIREIGRALDVASVLEGSVRKDADMVRITAQLIDVDSGFHLWSDTYDREMQSVFAIQDEISRAIVNALEPTLAGETPNQVRDEETSAEAYEEYLRGRFHWNRRTQDGIRLAIEHFRRSATLDPSFPRARAGLADAYALLPLLAHDVDAETAWTTAASAAEAALEMDPALAEAWASSGLLRGFRYDLGGATEAYQRAIELNPGYATAHHWLSLTLSELGRHDEAVAAAGTARELDPLSPVINRDLALVLLWSGAEDAAARHLEASVDLDPGFSPFWYALAMARRWQGDYRGLEEALVRWAEVTGRDAGVLREVAAHITAYASTGAPNPLPSHVTGWLDGDESATAGLRASLYALGGQREDAIRWLDRSLTDRSYADHFPAVNPAFDFLREDPAFRAIMERLRSAEGAARSTEAPSTPPAGFRR